MVYKIMGGIVVTDWLKCTPVGWSYYRVFWKQETL